MSSQSIEEFARLLVREVRDRAIANCDSLLDPEANGLVAKRWHREEGESGCNDFARYVIPDCVDNVLFCLLDAIDSGVLRLSYRAHDGSVADLDADGGGELAGWYMASGEWRARYSEKRFVDDFGDL